MKILSCRAFLFILLISVYPVYPLSVQSANSWVKLNDTSNTIYYSKGWNLVTQADYSEGTCYRLPFNKNRGKRHEKQFKFRRSGSC